MTSTTAALVRRFYAELWEAADETAAPTILHPDLVFRGSLGSERRGIDGFWRYLEDVRGALDDYRCDIVSLIVEGDRAAARMWFHGVQTGAMLGLPATGERIGWSGAAFFEIRDARLADIWVLGDTDGLRAALAAAGRSS